MRLGLFLFVQRKKTHRTLRGADLLLEDLEVEPERALVVVALFDATAAALVVPPVVELAAAATAGCVVAMVEGERTTADIVCMRAEESVAFGGG
jgi:hypothetical protein